MFIKILAAISLLFVFQVSGDEGFYRANPQRTGVYQTAALRKLPDTRWQVHLTNYGMVAPVLAGDVIYAATHEGGELYVVDKENGEILWNLTGHGNHVTPPATKGATIIFGSTAGLLEAVQDGEPLWSFETDSAIWAAPLWVGDSVYITTENGTLYAVDTRTGREQWQLDLGSMSLIPAAYENGTLYAATTRTILAIDPNTQDILWQLDDVGVWTGLAVSEGVVYGGSDNGNFYAIQNGEIVWTFEGENSRLAWSSPVVNKDAVYAGNRYQAIYAFDKAAGIPLWSVEILEQTINEPILAEDTLYVTLTLGDTARLLAFNSPDGSLLWELPIESGEFIFPIIEDSVLYLTTHTGDLYALE